MSHKQQAQQDTKSQDKITKAIESEQQSAPEYAGLTASLARPGNFADLPSKRNNRGVRQAAVLQMQQQYGNAYVQRKLAPSTCQRCGAGDCNCHNKEQVVQRQTMPAPGVDAKDTTAISQFIVDDEVAVLEPGQMRKAEFLETLKTAVCAAADEALAGTIYSAVGCPYVTRVFSTLPNRSAAYIERGIRRFAPEAAAVTDATGYIDPVIRRVKAGIANWLETGEVTGVPAGLASLGSSIGSVGVSAGEGMVNRQVDETVNRVPEPVRIQRQLRGGRPLEGSTRIRMESALGHPLGRVKVHTGYQAAQLAHEQDARAFTIGNDVVFGNGEYQPGTLVGDAILAHELAHVVQQRWSFSNAAIVQREPTVGERLEEDANRSTVGAVMSMWTGVQDQLSDLAKNALPHLQSGLRLQRCGGESINYAPETEIAHKLSDAELARQIDNLRAKMNGLSPGSAEHKSMEAYVFTLEEELSRRPAPEGWNMEDGAYPNEVAMFSGFLVRGGYIKKLAELLPAEWAAMSESQLTAYLAKTYSEEELKKMFLAKYDARAAIKARFRKLNIVSALVIGLIWARENIKEGEWLEAMTKVGGSGVAAYAFNKLLYARDAKAAEIMARKAGNFGRWFRGAARGNKLVNFLSRRVAGGLLLWEVKDIFMSGGSEGPNIPFDVIYEMDINDPSSWEEPSPTMLNMGFDIWYRQKCTPEIPEACTAEPLYLGKIEGSAIGGLGKITGIGPYRNEDDRLYRIEGKWDVKDFFLVAFGGKEITAEDNVLVLDAGEISGSKMSGRGHYLDRKVTPANEAAVELLGGVKPRWVHDYLLRPVKLEDADAK